MTHSITEHTRLTEELDHFKSIAKSPNYTKPAREAALREIRKIEKQLGIVGASYNSEQF